VSDPLVAVTLNVKVPTEAIELAMKVSGELAAPPDGGVIGDGSEKVTPAGAVPTHEAVNVTPDEKPLSEVAVIVAEPVPP